MYNRIAGTCPKKYGRQSAKGGTYKGMHPSLFLAYFVSYLIRMTKPIHLVGISGSLRTGSHNTALLRAVADVLPEGVTF